MAKGGYCPQYLEASFKGFPFQAVSVDSDGHGRRVMEGEFVFGDVTDALDMGIKINHYNITAEFSENSHLEDAKAFMAVCASPGEGLLSHPANGQILVICTSAKFTNDLAESQGITQVELQFVDAGGFLGIGGFFGQVFGLNIQPFVDGVRAFFGANYNRKATKYLDAPYVVRAATNAIASLQGNYLRGIGASQDVKLWQAAAALNNSLTLAATQQNADALFSDYENGAKLVSQVTKPENRFKVFRSIANDNALASSSQAEGAVYSAMRMIAGAHMTQAAIDNPGRTIGEGLEKYDAVMALLEQEALIARRACNDALFLQIRDFAANAGQQILKTAYGLPAMTRFNFYGGTHSLVAAYSIFGDAKRYSEIEANNGAYLPFMVGPSAIVPSI